MTKLIRLINAGARTIDVNRGLRRPPPPEYAISPEANLFDIIAGGDHREQNVDICQILRLVHHSGTVLAERLGLRLRPVPYRERIAAIQKTRCHGKTHSSQ